MKTLYSSYAEFYEQGATIPQQADNDEVRFFCALTPAESRSVLDIGAAEGKLSVALARKGHSVTAADISNANLERTRQWAEKQNVNISTVSFDAEDTIDAFEGKTYEIVFLNDVVEHFRNPVRALANVRELLKPKGVLYIHTPNCVALHRLKQYIFRPKIRRNFFDPSQLGDFHFQTYDQMTLEKTLNFVGLKVDAMIPTRLAPFTFSKIKRFFPDLSRPLAKLFPHLADTLLFKCSRAEPIDVSAAIRYWESIF